MSVARSRTRTRASSQTLFSRNPPKGSVATRSRTRSYSRAGRTEDAISSSAFSRSDRDSWLSSRTRGQEDRRYSRVSAATVAPDDSISLAKPPSSQDTSVLPPQGSRAPGRFSTAGSIRSRDSRAPSSRLATALSGSGQPPLTENNLEALNAAPQLITQSEGQLQGRGYTRSSRRAPRKLNATVEDIPDDAPETRSFLRWQSRRGSMTLDDRTEHRSLAPSSQERSRRYSRVIDDGPQTEPETTATRWSRRSSRCYSVSADHGGDSKEEAKGTAVSTRRRNTVSANAPAGSRVSQGGPSQIASSLMSQKQTILPSNTPARSFNARTRHTSVSASENPRSTSRKTAVVPGPSESRQLNAAPSKTSAANKPNTATDIASRRDSMSPTTSPAKKSFDIPSGRSEAVASQSGTATRDGSQFHSKVPPKELSAANAIVPEAATESPLPTAPPASQWSRKLHIVEVRRPDGRVIRDREYTMQRKSG